MRIWCHGVVVLTALVAHACYAPKQPRYTASPNIERVTEVHQCRVSKSIERPMLVEWPATEKATLHTNAKSGIVVVRYDGCRLKMLEGCDLDGTYTFDETPRSRDGFLIRNKNELFTKLPLGAVSLEGEIGRGNTLSLSYVAVGTKTAQVEDVTAAKLSGNCEGATHYVRSMIVGAYELAVENVAAGRASMELGPAGSGGSIEKQSSVLRSDGNLTACSDNATPGKDRRCQAIVQLVLAPIFSPSPSPVAPPAPAPPVATVPTEKEESPAPTPVAPAAGYYEVLQFGTKLVWIRCPLGQTWRESGCSGQKRQMTWEAAKSACPTGYRLPTREEATELLGGCDTRVRSGKNGRCSPCGKSTNCRDTLESAAGWYWTSSSAGPHHAWGFALGSGRINGNLIGREDLVWCVRTAQ